MKRNERMRIVLLGLYLVSLILFGLLKFDGTFDIVIRTHKSMISNDGVNINMIPFRTIRTYWDIKGTVFIENIIGNLVMFLPLGFFLERIFKKNRVKTVGLCFLGVLLFEVSQFVLRIGYFDVDDIILNISGCVIGILISIIKIKKEGK